MTTSTARAPAGGTDGALGRPLVVLEKVNKSFGPNQVLFDIDLTVHAGEVVVVIGPSGSGKSTVCRCINRLETIDSGRITLDGVPLPAEGKALAMDPKVIMFDEPTSALDPEMINEVLDVMTELAHEGMTMIVVTHEMGFARSAANRVVFMDDGRIVESNNPDAFFSHPDTDRARDFLSKILHH